MNEKKAISALIVVAVLCAWTYIALTGEPRLPINDANGEYTNPCCGTLVLKSGVMTVANQSVGYVIEQDKAGPYVLPNSYVGVSANQLIVRSTGTPLKLHLDIAPHPHRVELFDDRPDAALYTFNLIAGS